MLIDSHCHLHDSRFDPDRPEVIQRARESGVVRMVTVGTDLETSRRAIGLAREYDFLHPTVGVHPHEVKHLRKEEYPRLEEMARSPGVVGFGEIGLDYHYMHSPAEDQRVHFRAQIRLAVRLGLPLILHVREAFPDALRILREEEVGVPGGVLHCFSGDLATATEAIEMGLHISFSGILTFPNADDLREVARLVPADRILLETDSPYLAPVPVRGKRNEPAHVSHVAEALARIRNLGEEEVRKLTGTNTRKLFPGLDEGSTVEKAGNSQGGSRCT